MSGVIERRMAGQTFDGFALLDAVEHRDGTNRFVTLFFDSTVNPDDVAPPEGGVLHVVRSIGGATILSFTLPEDAPTRFTLFGQPHDLTCTPAERELFARCNAIAALRNGESLRNTLDWLAYHVETQAMDAAIIVDQAGPDAAKRFAADLQKGLESRALACRVSVVSSDLPLGRRDLPPEAHPFCVPGAPGKDRMDIPPPDPFTSPLGVLALYEILRVRFLADARAVTNIDVQDLLAPSDQSVFDTAVAAQGGLISLNGQHCYPWRVREADQAHYADHICVPFDTSGSRQRWCIAPKQATPDAVWRLVRVGNATPDASQSMSFYRYMSLRRPEVSISKIVPKSSLIEHEPLLEMSRQRWGHKPVRMPKVKVGDSGDSRGRCAIVTTMKNEGPFILEWLAYHRAIGFDDILVYTNDCTDGTDTMLDLLQDKGIVQHRDNKFRGTGRKPQHAALRSAEDEEMIQQATWVTCIDVDEYVNIKCGDGTLDALFAAVPDANLISMTWRLFGNADIHGFADTPVTEQFLRCAPELARKPHQAWGFKTLFRNIGLFKKLGVHRPKGLNPQLWEEINWVNGSGAPLPPTMYRNSWRSTNETYGYDLVQLNHYAVRSAESFLVKRDRGRVNHVERDQGLEYWFRMNNNFTEDRSILRMVPKMRRELARLMDDPDIAAAHTYALACHRAKIDALMATPAYSSFYADLTSSRMEKLARLHGHFGSNVFLSGPAVVPDEIVDRNPEEDWFFTVRSVGEARH